MARRQLLRGWQRWAVGGVAIVLLLVVGGPFVFIHFIEGKAAAPLSLASLPTTPTTPSTTSTASAPGTASQAGATSLPSSAASTAGTLDGSWNLASGSQAGYRIKETLFGQSNTAVGRTSALTGNITIAGTTVTGGTFSADMTRVSSDQSQRDGQFRNRIMDTSTFPMATFVLTRPMQLTTVPPDGVQITATATGDLTLHGTTKSVTFQVAARRSGSTIAVSGSIPITFADWNISNPSGGPATTEDHGILEFLLNFTHG